MRVSSTSIMVRWEILLTFVFQLLNASLTKILLGLLFTNKFGLYQNPFFLSIKAIQHILQITFKCKRFTVYV